MITPANAILLKLIVITSSKAFKAGTLTDADSSRADVFQSLQAADLE